MLKQLLLAAFAACLFSFGAVFAADKININTATADQLQMLDGVGPATANAIIEYRNSHGEFGSVAELLAVKGIGEKKLEMLSESVTVSTE